MRVFYYLIWNWFFWENIVYKFSYKSIPEPILSYGAVRENFAQVSAIISKIDFTTTRSILQFSYSLNRDFFLNNYKLTQQQEILYGFNEVQDYSLNELYNKKNGSEQSIYKE